MGIPMQPTAAAPPGQRRIMLLTERLAMQHYVAYFNAYWKNSGNEWKDLEKAGLVRFDRITVPFERPGLKLPDARPAGPDLDILAKRFKVAGDLNPNKYRETEQQIAQGACQIVHSIQPLKFTVERILGKGGQGMAVLIKRQEQDGSYTRVVLKMSITNDAPKDETDNLHRLAGARHIIQRLFLRHLPRPSQAVAEPEPQRDSSNSNVPYGANLGQQFTNTRSKRKAEDNIYSGNHKRAASVRPGADEAASYWDTHEYAYTMEYMRYGDLYGIMTKMGLSQGRKFRDHDLWQVFHSLFRGVVAMAYPDSWHGGKDPNVDQIVQVFETIPLYHTGQPWNTDEGMIHFDIDSQNAMVGDFDGTHPGIPIVKVGDLGLAESYTLKDRQDYMKMMRTRRRGKPYIFTPEQNSVDWNYLWHAPIVENEPVAGNYNWWTNLYQIALIMWSMITLYFPDEPPQASRCMWTINTPAGPKQVPIWTYGGLLTQEIDATSIHSMTLREVVAWCMAVDPNRRPTLTLMARIFADKCSQPEHEAGADRKISLDEFLRSPPAPPTAM